jgi:hypothetical protein
MSLPKKNTFLRPLWAAGLLFALVAGSAHGADARPVEPEVFALHATKRHLLVNDPDGRQVASLPPDTLGQVVRVGRYAFEVSFGRTSDRESTLTLTSSNNNPKKLLSFAVNGHHVELEPKNGELLVSLTLIISDEDDVTVDKALRLVATSFRAPVWIDGTPTEPSTGASPTDDLVPARAVSYSRQAMASGMDKDPSTVSVDPLDSATGNTGSFGDVGAFGNGWNGLNSGPISHLQLPVIGLVRINLNPSATTPF